MKLMAEDYVVEFLVSRGLYVLANSAVPVLLAIAVASEGYSASGVGLVLGVGALPGILGALLAPQMLVHVSPKTMFGGAAAAWIVICSGIAMLSHTGSVGLGVSSLCHSPWNLSHRSCIQRWGPMSQTSCGRICWIG